MTFERVVKLRSGDVLSSLRKSAGLSQRQLAEPAGVTRGAISHWERGRNLTVTRASGAALARTLGVPLHVLFDLPAPSSRPEAAAHARTRRKIGQPAAAPGVCR